MKRTQHYKNRAPQKGSSAFFSGKRERISKQYYTDPEEKFKNPDRAFRRKEQLKNRESKRYRITMKLKSYNDLTLFKTFLTFLRRKPDFKLHINEEKLLTYDMLTVSDKDITLIKTYLKTQGVSHHMDFNEFDVAYGELHLEIQFTNYNLHLNISRQVDTKNFSLRDHQLDYINHHYFNFNHVYTLQMIAADDDLNEETKLILLRLTKAINTLIKTPSKCLHI